ncbi:MAG: hypothetical protein IJ074_06385 [Clostridia bacterium]|nr:hypothetical protein [Clostridia bacterium]
MDLTQGLIVIGIAFVCYLAGMLTMRVISRTDALETIAAELMELRTEKESRTQEGCAPETRKAQLCSM